MGKYESLEVDLSQLCAPDIKFAVQCETEEEAAQFISAVIEQFPEKESHIHPRNTMWRYGVAYFPDLNNVENDPFMHGSLDFANNYGYTVVHFRDLIVQAQLDESDMPLTMLLGLAKV